MRSPSPAGPSAGHGPRRFPGGWWLVGGLALAALGLAYEPAQDDGPPSPRILQTVASGGTADSNDRMIAVTGVDLTGTSILYLIDTESKQICVYQASGGSASTQGIKFVGARRIELDLLLDGFNDKTESEGKPLKYKDLRRMFESQGLDVGAEDR